MLAARDNDIVAELLIIDFDEVGTLWFIISRGEEDECVVLIIGSSDLRVLVID